MVTALYEWFTYLLFLGLLYRPDSGVEANMYVLTRVLSLNTQRSCCASGNCGLLFSVRHIQWAPEDRSFSI